MRSAKIPAPPANPAPTPTGKGRHEIPFSAIRNRVLMLWLRYAEARHRHPHVGGTGLEPIRGSVRGKVKALLQVKF